jgi:hypothetical protein
MIFNKINLRDRVIRKFESLIEPKYDLLKTKKIYFDKTLGEISHVTTAQGFNIFVRHDGSRVFPRAIDGKELMDIIQCIKKNDIYTFIYTENQKCKVKPKKR